MKILFLTFGTEIIPSSRTRVYQYLPFFKNDGTYYKVINNFNSAPYILTNIINSSNREENQIMKRLINILLFYLVKITNLFNVIHSSFNIIRAILVVIIFKYDMVFIQKVFFPVFILRFLKKCGKKIVFDFDDAIYNLDGIFRNRERFNELLPLYDLVVIENEECKDYVESHGNKKTLLITGPIDTERYFPHYISNKPSITIGWIGSPSTQKYLEIISETLSKLGKKYKNINFKTIGSKDIRTKDINLIQKNWTLETEVKDLSDFDIGIMPLPDDNWTRGKGGYKLLQYMAMGIPCCASPIGINKELIREGENGFLVESQDEWFNALSNLIENEELRKTLGSNGRDIAEARYSFNFYYKTLKERLNKL